jgi:hypothetical protein
MKLATFTAVAVLFSAGYAFAGAGAPVPEGSQSGEPSGRPSAVLDDAACQNVWKMASPNGDTLVGESRAVYREFPDGRYGQGRQDFCGRIQDWLRQGLGAERRRLDHQGNDPAPQLREFGSS